MKKNSETFFKKYGFTQTYSAPHPIHKDEMTFEGLEAQYVTSLEHRVRDLEKYIQIQNDKIDFLMNKEFYKWKGVPKEPSDE